MSSDPHYDYHAQQFLLHHPEVATFSEPLFLAAMQAASSAAAYQYARQGLQYATHNGRRLPTTLDTIEYAMDFLERPITATVDSHEIELNQDDDYKPPLVYQTAVTMKCSLYRGREKVMSIVFCKSSEDSDKMELQFERKVEDEEEQEQREFWTNDMTLLAGDELFQNSDEETFEEHYRGPSEYTDEEKAMVMAAIRFFKASIPYYNHSDDLDYDEEGNKRLLRNDERPIGVETALLPLTDGGFQLAGGGTFSILRADWIARPREEDRDDEPNDRPQRRRRTQIQHRQPPRRHLFHRRY